MVLNLTVLVERHLFEFQVKEVLLVLLLLSMDFIFWDVLTSRLLLLHIIVLLLL